MIFSNVAAPRQKSEHTYVYYGQFCLFPVSYKLCFKAYRPEYCMKKENLERNELFPYLVEGGGSV